MTYSIPRRDALSRFAPSFIAAAGLVALWAAIGSTTSSAKPTEPSATDRQITVAVSTLMEKTHLSGQQLDNTISAALPGHVHQGARSAQAVLLSERRR